MPTTSATENPCKTGPPSSSNTTTTMRVVKLVMMVRERVWLTD